MKLVEKILLATDLSEAAEDVLRMARFVARTFESEVTLIHVVPEVQDAPFTLDALREEASEQLQKIQAGLTADGIQTGQAIVETGTPFEHIVQHADLNNVNVIMMGSGEATSQGTASLGITAERVVRRASKPVWVVKKGGDSSIEKILCPVDLSEPSNRALRNAIHLSRRFKAELTVLTVVPPLRDFFLGLRQAAAQREQETYTRRKQEQFDRFLGELDFHKVTWHKAVRQGKAHQEILRAVQETGCDLMVMGSVGLTENPQILMGKVAERVVREVPCSVVTVRKTDPIRLQVETEFSDLGTHLRKGRELLENGFPEEAIREFQRCIDNDAMYASAWDGLAAAHERLGHKAEADRHRARAKEVRERLWIQRVEAEIRGRHLLGGKGREDFY